MATKEPNKNAKLNIDSISDLLDEAISETEQGLSMSRAAVKFDSDPEALQAQEEVPSETPSELLKKHIEESIGSDPTLSNYLKSNTVISSGSRFDEIHRIISGDIDEAVLYQCGQTFIDKSAVTSEMYVQSEMFPSLSAAPHRKAEHKRQSEEETTLADIAASTDTTEYMLEDENQMTMGVDSNGKILVSVNDEDAVELAFKMLYTDAETEKGSANIPTASQLRREAKKRMKDENERRNAYEYKSPSQNEQIVHMLNKAKKNSFTKLLCVFGLFLIILIMDLTAAMAGGLAEIAGRGKLSVIYSLVDLQILCIIAVLNINSLQDGAKRLFKGNISPESLLFISMVFSMAHSAVSTFCAIGGDDIILYNFPAAAAALCLNTVNYFKCRRDLHAFSVVSSEEQKYAAVALSKNAKEADAFYMHLLNTSDMYAAKKASFITNFFERTKRSPKSDRVIALAIPVLIISAIVMFGLTFFLKDYSFYKAITAAQILVSSSLPLSAFFLTSLPLIAANRIGKRNGTAFIGNAVAEEYADAAVISFADTEVFPAENIKLATYKMLADYRLDLAIADLKNIFSYLGGPLKDFFGKSIDKNDYLVAVPPRLIESAADGVTLSMNNRTFTVGKYSYLSRCGFSPVKSDPDDAFESGNGSIMYLAINDVLAIKFYLRYTVNEKFEALLRDMYKACICVGIKTLDPNIDNDLLSRCIKFKKCPITILKADTPEELNEVSDTVDSGIVSTSPLHTFLRMFIIGDRARHAIKSNTIITVTGLIISIFTMFFSLTVGNIFAVSSILSVLLQLVWVILTVIMSFML